MSKKPVASLFSFRRRPGTVLWAAVAVGAVAGLMIYVAAVFAGIYPPEFTLDSFYGVIGLLVAPNYGAIAGLIVGGLVLLGRLMIYRGFVSPRVAFWAGSALIFIVSFMIISYAFGFIGRNLTWAIVSTGILAAILAVCSVRFAFATGSPSDGTALNGSTRSVGNH